MRPFRLLASLLVAAAVTMTANAGRASECSGPEIEADAAVKTKWPDAVADLRAHVATLQDVDRCARIDLLDAGAEVIVVVSLADGRTTLRRVTHADELPSVVEALLVLPPADKSDAPIVPDKAPPPNDSAPTTPPAPAASALPPERGFIEVGVGGAGRALGRPFFLGLGLTGFAQMHLGSWLLDVRARIDMADLPVGGTETPDDYAMRSLGIGVGAGRRMHAGVIDVDVLLGLSLLRQHQEGRPPHSKEVRATQTDARFVLGTRLSEAGPAKFRAFLSADVEAWLPEHNDDPPAPLPAWPYWSFGVAFGVTWVGT